MLEAEATDRPPEANPLASLNRLFVQALLALGRAGEEERACEFAAAGWSALRHTHVREAEKLNGLLHALTHTRHSSPSCKGGNHARQQDS